MQCAARLRVLRIIGNARDRTQLLALRLIEMAHALGAFIRVDLINQLAHGNSAVRAGRFTDIAVDAIVGDHQCHNKPRCRSR